MLFCVNLHTFGINHDYCRVWQTLPVSIHTICKSIDSCNACLRVKTLDGSVNLQLIVQNLCWVGYASNGLNLREGLMFALLLA